MRRHIARQRRIGGGRGNLRHKRSRPRTEILLGIGDGRAVSARIASHIRVAVPVHCDAEHGSHPHSRPAGAKISGIQQTASIRGNAGDERALRTFRMVRLNGMSEGKIGGMRKA